MRDSVPRSIDRFWACDNAVVRTNAVAVAGCMGKMLSKDKNKDWDAAYQLCKDKSVFTTPEPFLKCFERMQSLPSGDRAASSACKNPRARENPEKFHACRETLARQYGYDKATQTCTIPHVLNDPAGFLKRNPAEPVPEKSSGKGAVKR
jgi:hypothetical protein